MTTGTWLFDVCTSSNAAKQWLLYAMNTVEERKMPCRYVMEECNLILPVDKTLGFIYTRVLPNIFSYVSSGEQNEAFSYIHVLLCKIRPCTHPMSDFDCAETVPNERSRFFSPQ